MYYPTVLLKMDQLKERTSKESKNPSVTTLGRFVAFAFSTEI